MNFPFTIHCAGGAIAVVVLSSTEIPFHSKSEIENLNKVLVMNGNEEMKSEQFFSDELKKCAIAVELEFVK